MQRIASGPTDTEVLLWTCQEMYVYQIPPLKNESGHRANDWDVNKWLWQGKLQLVATNDTLQIRLLDAATAARTVRCASDAAAGPRAQRPSCDGVVK